MNKSINWDRFVGGDAFRHQMLQHLDRLQQIRLAGSVLAVKITERQHIHARRLLRVEETVLVPALSQFGDEAERHFVAERTVIADGELL